MEGWKKKKLEDLSIKMQSGGTPLSSNKEFYKGNIPFVAIDDMTNTNKYLVKTKKRINNEAVESSSTWVVPKMSVLYSIYATLGVPRINLVEVATNQAIMNIVPDLNEIDVNFLFYALQHKRNSILSQSGQTTQSNLSAGIVRKFQLEIPKLVSEQTQIAQILSTIDRAIEQTTALLQKYQSIKTGLMQDLLTKGIDEQGRIRSEETHEFWDSEVGRIPREWDCLRIDEIYDVKSGATPLRSLFDRYFRNGLNNWVKTLDLNESRISETQERITDVAINETSCTIFPKDSILVAMYGGWEQIGRTGVLENPAATNQAISALYKSKRKMDADFIQMFLQYFRYKWKAKAVSTRKDPNITKNDIDGFYIAVPDYEEQVLISKKIDSNKKLIENYQLQLEKLALTKTALMQDLLTGKKRVTTLLQKQDK